MRKLFSLFVALLATTSLWAQRFQVGDLCYNITSGTTVEVTSQTSSYPYNEGVAFSVATIPSTVTYNGTTYSVTSIGGYAFWDCFSLTSVTIPNSVTSIGNSAFYGCYDLTSITIPNNVTSIGDEAFEDCSSLTSITIPNSVTSIGDEAFERCSSLASIVIPESVTSIGDETFRDCSSLTSITIPNSVTSIGDHAFLRCSSLTSPVYNAHCFAYLPTSFKGAYVIPEGIKQIAGGAFYECTSLTSITIPNSVTSIGLGAFRDCSSLTSVTIPNSVTSIGSYAFSSCSSLISITCLGTTPPTLGTDVFNGTKLSIVYIPDNTLSAYQTAWGNEYVFVNNETTLTLHVATPGTLEDLIFDAGTRAQRWWLN